MLIIKGGRLDSTPRLHIQRYFVKTNPKKTSSQAGRLALWAYNTKQRRLVHDQSHAHATARLVHEESHAHARTHDASARFLAQRVLAAHSQSQNAPLPNPEICFMRFWATECEWMGGGFA